MEVNKIIQDWISVGDTNAVLTIEKINIKKTLPIIPEKVKYLVYNSIFSDLKKFPILPRGLLYLECAGSNIKSLPELPSGLISLNCEFNMLESLPRLPEAKTS